MTCLSLYNRQYEAITDAEVLLNGERVDYRSGYGYCVENIPKPPYHIHIHHRDYLDAGYVLGGLPGELYLLRDGEDYFYQQGIRRPIVRRRDLLLVIAASRDASGEIIEPAEARRRLEKILAATGLVIITDYGRAATEAMNHRPGIRWRYSYLISRSGGAEFSEDPAELKILRSDSAVESAGPALMISDNTTIPAAYGRSIQIHTRELSEEEARNRLNEHGYSDILTFHSGNLRLHRVELPAETGMSMNAHVERIAAIDGVVESEPEIILYE